MRKNNLIIAMVLSAGMMFASCGNEKAPESETEATTEMEMETEAATEQTAEVNTTHEYICPMNCENSASHEPGLCPVCGMDLALNENFAGSTEATPAEETTAPVEAEATEGTE